MIEKPFGYDLASARQLNAELLEVFEEPQIFRIDHYLGKETVQNLMAMRFANALFEPVWNRNYIDHVQITAAEDIGIGGRAGYYEHSGALRDLVQNHMLQLLALLTMEPPTAFTADRLRDEKLKVLEAIVPPSIEEVAGMAVRAQYGPGVVGGEQVPGYREEEGVRRGLAHRDLRRAAPARLQLALGRGAVLPAHRQAAVAQADRDRRDPQADPASGAARARVRSGSRPTRSCSRCSLTRACRSRSAPRSRARGCASAPSTWSSATARRFSRSRRRPTSG